MKTAHTPKYYVNGKHVGIIYDDDPQHEIIARVRPKNEQGDPRNSDLLRELIRKGNSHEQLVEALEFFTKVMGATMAAPDRARNLGVANAKAHTALAAARGESGNSSRNHSKQNH